MGHTGESSGPDRQEEQGLVNNEGELLKTLRSSVFVQEENGDKTSPKRFLCLSYTIDRSTYLYLCPLH